MGKPKWVVILEMDRAACRVEVRRLRLLLAALPDAAPVALRGDDRFAVQFHRAASCVVEAVAMASADMCAALGDVGLRQMQLIRVEVLAQEEFERETRFSGSS